MGKRFNYLVFALTALFLLSCQKAEYFDAGADTIHEPLRTFKAEVDALLNDHFLQTRQVFDWNRASDEVLFKALMISDSTIVIGYTPGDESSRESIVQNVLRSEGMLGKAHMELDDILVYEDQELGFLQMKVTSLVTVRQVRKIPGVSFTEVNEYIYDIGKLLEGLPTDNGPTTQPAEHRFSPMILDPNLENPDYYTQVRNYRGGQATTLRRHGVDRVYRELGLFGESTGVAVLDNGILPEDYDFIVSNGYGPRAAEGYYNPLWFIPFTGPDGSEPQQPDIFFLSQFVEGQWEHGGQQVKEAMVTAPNAAIYSVRSSPLVLLINPAQFIGVIESIKAMATDPQIRIISMSMGSLFQVHRLTRAIQYFNEQDKIMLSAAGTSFPVIKDIIGVIFPANTPDVLGITGVENRESTGGAFVDGEASHVGPEVDFCVENHSSSSEATSGMAGMVALVWSANPALSREQVLDILTSSSYFFKENGGAKDAVFGWGTIDFFEAAVKALEM